MNTAEQGIPSFRGILSYLSDLAAKAPAMPVLGEEGRWLDAQKVLAIVEHLGSLLRCMNLPQGSRVLFRPCRNMASALMLLGLRCADFTAVLADPKQDMEEFLQGTEAELSIAAEITQTEKTCFTVFRTGDNMPCKVIDLYSLPPAVSSQLPASSEKEAFIIFTSGSTGKNKAVVLSESNLVSNLLDSRPLGDYRFGDRALGCLPLHHVFGLDLLAGAAVLGYGVYFPENREIPSLLSAIRDQKLTRMNGVPSLYLALAEQCKSRDVSAMRAGFIGGGPVSTDQFAYIEKKLGMTLIPVYGMSECIGISCASWQESLESRTTGVGKIYPMNTVKILSEDGSEAGPMEEGEICATGPMRMLGYLGQPMPREELLHTGDLGFLDENGVLHLTGRKKDIIIRNGNNLSARRIEEAILRLPGVRRAAVVALSDERQGEVPAAMVVTDGGPCMLTPDLPKNELPVLYHFADELPLTASGKPDRLRIKEVLSQCRTG